MCFLSRVEQIKMKTKPKIQNASIFYFFYQLFKNPLCEERRSDRAKCHQLINCNKLSVTYWGLYDVCPYVIQAHIMQVRSLGASKKRASFWNSYKTNEVFQSKIVIGSFFFDLLQPLDKTCLWTLIQKILSFLIYFEGQFLYNMITEAMMPQIPLTDGDSLCDQRNPLGSQLTALVRSAADWMMVKVRSRRSAANCCKLSSISWICCECSSLEIRRVHTFCFPDIPSSTCTHMFSPVLTDTQSIMLLAVK